MKKTETLFSSIQAIIGGLALSVILANAGGIVRECDEASLRAALEGAGVVKFECDGKIILSAPLVIKGYQTNDSEGNLIILRNTTLDANGHDVTIATGPSNLLIDTEADYINLTIKGIKFAKGGPVVGEGIGATAYIISHGVLDLSNCSFSKLAIGNYGKMIGNNLTMFDSYRSGVINNMGSMSLTNCTFHNNWGDIFQDSSQESTVVNCTFSSTFVPWDDYRVPTLAYYRYLVDVVAGKLTAINCIFVARGGWSTRGITDGGHNVFDPETTDRTAATSFLDPFLPLSELSSNGGLGPTLLPAPWASVVNAGNDLVCPSSDQRGITRPSGAHCDIGAVEMNAPAAASFGSIGFERPQVWGSESEELTPVRIIRTGDLSGYASVDFETLPGTATPAGQGIDGDYVPVHGAVTFKPGQSNQYFFVGLWAESYISTAKDPGEYLTLKLSSPSAGHTLSIDTAILKIRDTSEGFYFDITRLGGNRIGFEAVGPLLQTFELRTSTDLSSWELATTASSDSSGRWTWETTVAEGSTTRFFRIHY